MDAGSPNSLFPEFNLDPALAETVETASAEEIIEGIVRLEDPNEIPPQFSVVSRFNRICTGRFRAAHTLAIRRHPNVVSLKAARPVGVSYDEEDPTASYLPKDSTVPNGSDAVFEGHGCIVAALDFGLDFAHPNFLNRDGTTRFVAFWHQGAIYDATHPNRYGYGRIFSREEIDIALFGPDPYLALGYHPSISDTGSGSHGTHTLDIAAGNGRVGRAGPGSKADLIFVHLSTPRLGLVGDLGDSVRMLEGLDYVDSAAGGRPWVVNLSVGRTAGSHDGTSPVEQGMHELMRRGPGRVIVQSAGNYRSANLAVQGWLRDGEHRDLKWIVDPADTTDNEIDVWYSGKDRFVIAIRPPRGPAFVEVKLGDVADIVHEGVVVGRIYHRRMDPNNRDHHAEVFLYAGAPTGVWTVRLIGEYVINGRFHSWIERDLARPGAQSRFAENITSTSYTLGTIATSPLVITVGAYDANSEETPLAPFSSCGPTRDERRDKPELLAPGVAVVAARSIPRDALRQEGLLVARSGTSMATPHVTGAVAAMFEAAGRPVSIDEVRDCLRRSAVSVSDAESAVCGGWGHFNFANAIREIRRLNEPELAPGPQDVASPAGPWEVRRELAVYDTVNEDLESVLDGREIEVPLNGEMLMGSDPVGSILDRVELALRSGPVGRQESERRFLEGLLGELGGDLAFGLPSPVDLFRAAMRGNQWMLGDLLEVLALPSQSPRDSVRAGDWIVRAIPGAGDVGHIAVLASEELLSRSTLPSEGITAESAQPGYYGVVIEGGAFPHSRREPFARRFLDSRGRVPPHTLILRPTLAASDTADEALEPPPQRQPLVPGRRPGPPTGPLQPRQPSKPQQEIPRTVTVDLSANTSSTRSFRPERNDKSGSIELVAAVRYGSLIPANVTFRWRSEPPDAVGFGNQARQPAQGPTTIRVPVFARRPGRARIFLEALNVQQRVIDSASITLSVPQFFVVTDSQLVDLPRFTDNRQINQPATFDSALRQLGLLNDKEQIFSMVQGAVERIAGPRAAGTFNGCSRVHNVRFIWRISAQPDAVPNGLPAHLSTQVDLQGYPPIQLGTRFGNTAPAHPGTQNSAENPAELITVFAGMFELLTRENSTARDDSREGKDLRARLRTIGSYWRRNQNDPCARAFMRTILSRAVANTICHEMYHSLLTVRADERGAGGQAFDPSGHLREPSILRANRDFNARTGVRVTDETHFPAPRSYVADEAGIGPWQTLPASYHQRIWEFFPTPPQWPPAGQVQHESLEDSESPDAACPWWLPQDRSSDYFSYAQPQTWGSARLLINGRSSGGAGPNDDRSEPFDSMQFAVESTNPGDAVYLASWMFDPETKLTKKSPTAKTWGDLIAAKARHGVTFRLLLNEFPPLIKWASNFKALDALVLSLPPNRRDNVKYVLSRHPAHISLSAAEAAVLSKLTGLSVPAGDQHVAVHHQKFMVVRHADHVTAFCGGVDIIPGMTPWKWSTTPWHGWHDLQVQLNGPVTRDVEKEFVARWNRERGASRRPPLPDWSPHERLALTPLSKAEQIPGVHRTAVQMLRTVSESTGNAVGSFATSRRDDVRQAYQHGVACAEQFLYMENQYFRVPELADWIVARGAERPGLIVIVVVVHSALAEADDGKSALTDHGFFLQHETFDRLVKGLGADRVRFYEMNKRYVHSKLILADDRWWCIGSANVNPRGFGLDSELNVQFREPDPDVLPGFRKRLWAHNLGVSEAEAGGWSVSDFIAQWDKVAAANARKGRDAMAGEGILKFDYKKFPGKKLPVDVGLLANLGIQGGGSRSERLASTKLVAQASTKKAVSDLSIESDEAVMEDSVDEEDSLMNANNAEYFLDQAELALRGRGPGRNESETSFLQQLLSDLGGSAFAPALTPARLFRAAVDDPSLAQSAKGLLKVVALPSKQPEEDLQAGDWMLRVVPGTGDVGHASVIASGDLLTRSMLASEDIDAESAQPGFYGLVVEGGAFPHTRSEPFARRLLDSRGRVPPHTVILRPTPEAADVWDTAEASDEYTPASWLKVKQRRPTRFEQARPDSVETVPLDTEDEYTPASWLKIKQRRPTRFEQAEFVEDIEAFTFEPTGGLTDFGPLLRKAWHTRMQKEFKKHIDIATEKIKDKLGGTPAAAEKHLRFFSPASHSPTIKFTDVNVPWRAFPIRFGTTTPAILKLVDEPQIQEDDFGLMRLLRPQDEYCEWKVFRDAAKKIVRVIFTSEPPEYYDFLYDPGVSALKTFARNLLVKLYQKRCGVKTIPLADLEITVGGVTQYDPGNKWNNDFCVHLQQPANTLGAQVDIAARGAIVRSDASGTLISNVKTLIGCDPFGDPDRQSDPTIGDSVNKLARENRFLTLENPVGLYMTELDTKKGWTTPDKTDAQTFWKRLEGTPNKDPGKAMILRAQYEVPASKGYTISDIKIAGIPIEFGGQIAEHVKMRLGARFGPKDTDLKGGKLPATTPVVC